MSYNNKNFKFKFSFSWLYILLIAGIAWMLFLNKEISPQKIEWGEVVAMHNANDIKEIKYIRNDYQGFVTIRPDKLEKYISKYGGMLPKHSPHFVFLVSDKFSPEQEISAWYKQGDPDNSVNVIIDKDDKLWSKLFEWLSFPIMLLLIWFLFLRGFGKNNAGGGPGGGIFNIGRSPGKLADKNQVNVKFTDVAGLYGAKEEVMEIVDFLKSPAKYTKLGAKIPKGALLVGPPGTGKTMLAKAVAGEANVPFFSISGSDFVEMFVGVGASRVRDLFHQAKEKAPCIVFIDEIDAVGRARGKNAGFSGNDERENTLNQLLTEMDGFGTNSGVIILAATNRVDILDKALLRAGRFDRQIKVELPELKEREEIFNVHVKKLILAKDFDVTFMAKHTPGFSGADIANVCNEAALLAASKNQSEVTLQNFMDATERVIGGQERKKSTIITEKEKSLIAYHEAGHAVVGWILPYCDPVFKVSLIPRGHALGLTWYLPDEKKIVSKSHMIDKMCALMAGRVAEEMLSGELSTGAQNDLERITHTAYGMIGLYGMSDKVGHLSFRPDGYEFYKPYSEKTSEIIDEEVKNLVDTVYLRTKELLVSHKEELIKVAEKLVNEEVILSKDLEEILGAKAVEACTSGITLSN